MTVYLDIEKLLKGAPAPNTEKAYSGDVVYFWAWAGIELGLSETYPVAPGIIETFAEKHIVGLSPDVEAALIERGVKKGTGRFKVSTLRRKVDGVVKWHRMKGFENNFRTPRLKELFLAARRYETQQGLYTKQAKAITVRTLNKMLKTFRGVHSMRDIRDIAVLTFAFYTGGRRSIEVIEADFDSLYRFPGGYKYNLNRSKTDQLGKGSEKILRKPHSEHIKRWINAAGIVDGYIFRGITPQGFVKSEKMNEKTLSKIIKDRVEMIGLNPKHYSGHSLRRGFLTQCGMDGISLGEAMQCSGHKNVVTAMKYYEEGAMELNQATKINTRNRLTSKKMANEKR